MANTYAIQRMQASQAYSAPGFGPTVVYRPMGAGSFYAGAVLVNDTSGNAIEATADVHASAIVYGMAMHSSAALYSIPEASSDTYEPLYDTRFGTDMSGGLVADPTYTQIGIVAGVPGQVFEATGIGTTWLASMIGGQFAVEKDATTGFWVVDLSDTTNKAVNVTGLFTGPLTINGASTGLLGIPAVGDTNVRVYFTWMATALDPSVAAL